MQQTMTQAGFDLSVDARVAKLDLTKVMAHVADDTGLEGADLVRAEDLYRKFLTLVALNPGQDFTPNRLIDHVWHAHITFTRQYMADCEMLFGYYLHHEMISEQTNRLAVNIERTAELFEQTFSLPMSHGLVPAQASMSPCTT